MEIKQWGWVWKSCGEYTISWWDSGLTYGEIRKGIVVDNAYLHVKNNQQQPKQTNERRKKIRKMTKLQIIQNF